MYSFNKLLTIENVLNKVSSYQIFKYYAPDSGLGKSSSSPFRKDESPSFSIFPSSDGTTVLFKDFGTNESGDWIKFIKLRFGLSAVHEVLNQVNSDLNLGLYGDNTKSKKPFVRLANDIKISKASKTIIKVKYRDWEKKDAEFWGGYGISIKQLVVSKTYPIQYYWINNSGTILANELAYVYHFYKHNGVELMKIYQPYSKDWKWSTNLDSTVVDGIRELSTQNKLLIITKSRKDRLVLNNLGYDAVSVNNEGSFLPERVFERFRNYYKLIILFYDNDKAGINNAEEVSVKYNIPNISIPLSWGEKDISDLVRSYGGDVGKELITKLIN